MKDLCWGCRKFKDVAYVEERSGHTFCEECQTMQPLTSDEWARVLLTHPASIYGPPFKPGDKVNASQVISSDGNNVEYRFEGVGEVAQVSMSLEHGGTPVYPTFRVVFSEKAHQETPDEFWYPETCLEKVG